MIELIKQTEAFLLDHLQNSNADEKEKKYRYEHTLRVMRIGHYLAKLTGANIKIVLVSCLLHDVGKFDTENNCEHGRVSAKIAKDFLKSLNLCEKEINDICYAIAIHVDGKADFDYEDTLEAKIVSDADNIDRFGEIRIHSMMEEIINSGKSLDEQLLFMENKINTYKKYYEGNILETKEGNELFKKQLKLCIDIFDNYSLQLRQTKRIDYKEFA